MTENGFPLSGIRLGIFGKGGAGKSTTTVLLARVLRKQGYDVCILDADSTNIGLHKALGIDHQPDPLIDYFGGMVFSGGRVTCPVDDPTPLEGAELTLDQLPQRFVAHSKDGIIYLAAGKLGGLGPGAGCDGPINKIARDFELRSTGKPLITLVDFKAGFEDSARGAITSLDWAIVVVDPTHASIQMAIHMKQMVEELRAGGLPATDHLEKPEFKELAMRIFREAKVQGMMVIINRVRDDPMERFLRKQLSLAGILPIGVIHEDPLITDAWLQGQPIDYLRSTKEIELFVREIATIYLEIAGESQDG